MPCSTFILTTEETTEDSLKIIGHAYMVTHGGVASIDSSDYKVPTNILIHAPAKISPDCSGF